MELNEIKKGIIVVVSVEQFGNPVGTITKIVSRPGEVTDYVFKATSKQESNVKEALRFIMCEATGKPYTSLRYNNKPVCFEDILNLRLANDQEKEQYQKGKYRSYKQQSY